MKVVILGVKILGEKIISTLAKLNEGGNLGGFTLNEGDNFRGKNLGKKIISNLAKSTKNLSSI